MNLAVRDVRRHLGRFIGTAAGLGLLLSVVIAMQGVYAGMVEDATILTRTMRADLWLVQRDTFGPFAETSRLDPTVEGRAAALPGVRSARPYTYQLIRRELHGDFPPITLVGLGWPDDPGRSLPLVRGRRLVQPHGEMIVDTTLGLEIGESLMLAGEPYRVVGLTRNALTYGGDSVAFMTVADTQLVAFDQPPEATLLERKRALERLRQTDLGRGQPAIEDLLIDPQWRSPSVSPPQLAAVLVEVEPHRAAQVVAVMRGWGDVSVYSQDEEERLLLAGVVQRSRLLIGLFSVMLTITAAVIVMMVMFNLTLEKTHDLAVLKLMGAPGSRLLGLVLQETWVLGVLAYGTAYLIGAVFFPIFPRRVVITPASSVIAPLATLGVVTLASVLGLIHVTRLDPARALEG